MLMTHANLLSGVNKLLVPSIVPFVPHCSIRHGTRFFYMGKGFAVCFIYLFHCSIYIYKRAS
jgi:hypothetical protein